MGGECSIHKRYDKYIQNLVINVEGILAHDGRTILEWNETNCEGGYALDSSGSG
jgi:hypothetical protein